MGRVISEFFLTKSRVIRDLIFNLVDRNFSGAGNWSAATGFAVTGGKMTLTAALDNAFTQLTNTFLEPNIVAGRSYKVVFTVSDYVSEGVRILVGSTGAGTIRTANGTYTENITSGGTQSLRIQAKGATVTTLNVDNISIKPNF